MCEGISSLVSGEDSQSSASAGLLYVLVLDTLRSEPPCCKNALISQPSYLPGLPTTYAIGTLSPTTTLLLHADQTTEKAILQYTPVSPTPRHHPPSQINSTPVPLLPHGPPHSNNLNSPQDPVLAHPRRPHPPPLPLQRPTP